MSLTRRQFIKDTAGAVAAISATTFAFSNYKIFAENDGNKQSNTETLFSFCRMCTKDDCAVKVKIENGTVVKVEGDEKSPLNKGALCPRGNNLISNLYNPYRVKTPMKRTNPKKGLNEDPGWVEISWDEALNTLAKKLKEARKTDPRGIIFNAGYGVKMSDVYFPASFIALGTPNVINSNGPLCCVHFGVEHFHGTFPVPNVDLTKCDYYITVGRTAGLNHSIAAGASKAITDAIERGMKLVVVDPRCSIEASKGEWVPIRPGTDLAFILALMNTILYEINKFDTEFVKNRTNGPYLIDNNGNYVRGKNGKPQIWDLASNSAKEFNSPSLKNPALEGEFEVNGVKVKTAFKQIKDAIKSNTPEWAEGVSTVPAQRIREIAKDFVEKARIGSTVKIGNKVYPYRPVAIICSRGTCNHQDGTMADIATRMLSCLVGAMDVPGSAQGCTNGPYLKKQTPDGLVTPQHGQGPAGMPFKWPPSTYELAELFPHKIGLAPMAFRNILDPKKYNLPEPKVLIAMGSNSITGLVQPDMVAQAISKIPFVATIAYTYDEMSQFSDVLLPEHAVLERPTVNNIVAEYCGLNNDSIGKNVTYVRQAVPPVYNSRLIQNILIDVIQRVGTLPIFNGFTNRRCNIGEYTVTPLKGRNKLIPPKKYTAEEIWERGLKSYFGQKFGYDYFKKNGGILVKERPLETCYNEYFVPDNPTKKTRFPLYYEALKATGEKLVKNVQKNSVQFPGWTTDKLLKFYSPIPTWKETALFKAPSEYDLFAVNYKVPHSMFRLGGSDLMPFTIDWDLKNDPYFNFIGINAKTAKAKGLADGDKVVVESLYGKLKGRIRTSQLFHPDIIAIGGATGRMIKSLGKSNKLLHFNKLLGAPPDTLDPISAAVENTPRVKISKV